MTEKPKPKLLAVTGISGSGKTPVCHFLSWTLKMHYEPEVAEYLIYQGMLPGVKADPVLFDHLCSKMELNRDKQLASHLPGWIVETWHPGNLAHMYARESPLSSSYVLEAKRSAQTLDVLCLHIQGKIEDSVKRTKTLNILGTSKARYDPESFLKRLVYGYVTAYRTLGVKVVGIDAERTSLHELELKCLKEARKFFGGLKWDYT